ncbi:MAG: TetR/AcrR family transcriptional regulator [Dehalococcoidia bacterium]
MDGFERRKERNKDHIRQVALDLFRAHGFKKVSISDIPGKVPIQDFWSRDSVSSYDGRLRRTP